MTALLKQNYQLSYKYVYNHDIMTCTAEGVIGNQLYSSRALGLTEPWDMIQLHESLESLWNDISAHYKRIGLSFTENIIWSVSLNHLGSHIGYHPSVFFFGPQEYKYWGDNEWLEIVNFINSKNNFISIAKDLEIDIPQTLCFDSVLDITEDFIGNVVFPCYLKAAISVSGVGIYRCEDIDDFKQALQKFNSKTPVQIQEEIVTETFLNLQYQISNDQVIRLAASEQILDGFVHQGNRVPAKYEPWDAVDSMAYWLKDRGMKGIFAFDVAVVNSENGVRFPAIECNPRFNGASYPTLIAQKLGISEWSAVNFTTKHRHLSEIDLTDIEYDSKTGEGAVIVNWGTVLEGKIVIMMAGSPDYQEALNIELISRL